MKTRLILVTSALGVVAALGLMVGLAAQAGSAQAAPDAQASGQFITVTVKLGENLAIYSRLYGVRGSSLLAVNRFRDPNLIFPGQVITIPVIKSFTPSLTTPFYYVVKTGDELFSLARLFEMDANLIASINGIKNNVLILGQTLLIPAGPHVHTVLQGETLKSIAARYGVSVLFLINGNSTIITNPDLIFTGQPVFVPIIYNAAPVPLTGAAGTPTPAAVTTATPAPGTATKTPTPAATVVSGNLIRVIVRSGESLLTYVARYGVTGAAIRGANPQLKDPNLIFPGDVIIIPVATSFTPSRATPFFYVVVAGDTTASIAAKFEMSSDTLTRANPGAVFAAGSTLLVPAGPHVYVVKAGDTLATIAGKYGTTVDFLLTGNSLPNPNDIFPGQQIFVPIQYNHAAVAFN